MKRYKPYNRNSDEFISLIKETFYYNNGHLFYKKNSPTGANYKKDQLAGFINKAGYRIISFRQGLYREHRLIWLLHKGYWPETLDHINGIRDDNRIENLRDVSLSTNAVNSLVHRAGKLFGTVKNTKKNNWSARIIINRKPIHLGVFDTEREAHVAHLGARALRNKLGLEK